MATADKIFEILDDEDLNDPFSYGSTNLYKASERIESFIKENYIEKEFIEWLYDNVDIPDNASRTWYVFGVDESMSFMTTNELYQYWLNKVNIPQ